MIPLGVLASSYVAPAGGGGGVTFLGTTSSTDNLEQYTFTGVDIGSASSDRVIIAAVHNRLTGTVISGVTIGGVTATQDAATLASSNAGAADIWRAAVPTGTTATVVVDMPVGDPANGCLVALWAITGHTVTVADTGSVAGGSSGSKGGTATVTATAGGCVIAANYLHYTPTVTTELTGVTEDYDLGLSGTAAFAGGHAYPTMAGDVTVVSTATGVFYARLCVVAYSLA